jgi:hypothetical protein
MSPVQNVNNVPVPSLIRSSAEGALRGKGRTPRRRVADDRRSRAGDRGKRPTPRSSKRLGCCCVSSRKNELLMVRDFCAGGFLNKWNVLKCTLH